MHERYEVITFDVGYTLVDMVSFGSILLDICREKGILTTMAALDAAVEQVWGDVMKGDATASYVATSEASRQWWREVNLATFRAAGLPPGEWHELEERLMAAVDDPANYSFFPDTVPTLSALRSAGYGVGLISNWGWNLPDLCEAWGLAALVDFITASARVGYAKPNPRIFEAALRQAGRSASVLLHVGDSHYADVGGARAAGIDAVLVNRVPKPAPEDCRTVTDLRELLPLLGLPPAG